MDLISKLREIGAPPNWQERFIILPHETPWWGIPKSEKGARDYARNIQYGRVYRRNRTADVSAGPSQWDQLRLRLIESRNGGCSHNTCDCHNT